MRLDKFKLITYQNIDIDERNVVTLLYQPLIGCGAYALYNTLWSLIDRSRLKSPEYLHTKIFDLLNLTPDKFIEARKILEAIALLEVYQNEDAFLYELKAPVSAEEFIKDGVLGALLYSKIGKTEFDDVSSLFRISNVEKNGYKNITTNFDEIFEALPQSVETDDEYISRSKSKIQINSNFDFEVFIDGLSKNFVDKRKLTSKVKDKIINLSYVYNLDEITMQKVFIDSVDTNKNVNLDKLSKSAKYWYSVLSESDSTKQSGYEEVDVNFETIKKLCLSYAPTDLIGTLTGHKPSHTESNTIERVINEFDYPREVLNFLLVYALENSQNQMLPHFNFLEKIYVGWKRNNVNTYEDAFNATVKYQENITKNKTKKTTKSEYEPDWLEDYMKEF